MGDFFDFCSNSFNVYHLSLESCMLERVGLNRVPKAANIDEKTQGIDLLLQMLKFKLTTYHRTGLLTAMLKRKTGH